MRELLNARALARVVVALLLRLPLRAADRRKDIVSLLLLLEEEEGKRLGWVGVVVVVVGVGVRLGAASSVLWWPIFLALD